MLRKFLIIFFLILSIPSRAMAGPAIPPDIPVKRQPQIKPDVLTTISPDFIIQRDGTFKVLTTKTGIKYIQSVLIKNIGKATSPSLVPIKIYLYACADGGAIPCKTTIPDCHDIRWINSSVPLKSGGSERLELDIYLSCAMKLGLWTHVEITANVSGGSLPLVDKEVNFGNNSVPEFAYAPM